MVEVARVSLTCEPAMLSLLRSEHGTSAAEYGLAASIIAFGLGGSLATTRTSLGVLRVAATQMNRSTDVTYDTGT